MTKYQFSLASLQAACVTGDCTALGYTKSESECDGDIIRCPFDTSKVFCKEATTKVCDTIGDILYDDKSCAVDISNLDPNRTPIGVVFDVSRKLAIALEQSSSRLEWASRYGDDILGLTNYTSSNKTSDYNGKSNTSIIIAHGDSNGYETPAADYCYNYVTIGTKKGDWYLPAGGELQLMYNNKTTLNNSLSKIGGTQFPTTGYYYYWSSSESNYGYAWRLGFNDSDWYNNSKGSKYYVRPVLAYQRF